MSANEVGAVTPGSGLLTSTPSTEVAEPTSALSSLARQREASLRTDGLDASRQTLPLGVAPAYAPTNGLGLTTPVVSAPADAGSSGSRLESAAQAARARINARQGPLSPIIAQLTAAHGKLNFDPQSAKNEAAAAATAARQMADQGTVPREAADALVAQAQQIWNIADLEERLALAQSLIAAAPEQAKATAHAVVVQAEALVQGGKAQSNVVDPIIVAAQTFWNLADLQVRLLSARDLLRSAPTQAQAAATEVANRARRMVTEGKLTQAQATPYINQAGVLWNHGQLSGLLNPIRTLLTSNPTLALTEAQKASAQADRIGRSAGLTADQIAQYRTEAVALQAEAQLAILLAEAQSRLTAGDRAAAKAKAEEAARQARAMLDDHRLTAVEVAAYVTRAQGLWTEAETGVRQVQTQDRIDWTNFDCPVTEHFTVGDILSHDRRRIPTNPEHQRNLVVMARELERIYSGFGPIQINSGYRPPEINAAVGGVENSQHLYGNAYDITPLAGGVAALNAWLQEHWYGALGLASTFAHVDNRNGKGVDTGGDRGGRWTYA